MTSSTQPVPLLIRVSLIVSWLFLGGLTGLHLARALANPFVSRREILVMGGLLVIVVVFNVQANWNVVMRGMPSKHIRPPYTWHLLSSVTISLVLVIVAVSWLLLRAGLPRETVWRGGEAAVALVVGTTVVVAWRIRHRLRRAP